LGKPINRKDKKMKRPLAYVTAAWRGDAIYDKDRAIDYCRAIYDAGYLPICPSFFIPIILHDDYVEKEIMSKEYLKQSKILIVCGNEIDGTVYEDIKRAEKLKIAATTLNGILALKEENYD